MEWMAVRIGTPTGVNTVGARGTGHWSTAAKDAAQAVSLHRGILPLGGALGLLR